MGPDLFDLAGRRALVTGASRGIGLALAQGLSNAGAVVVLNGRNPQTLSVAAAAIQNAEILAFDVTDHAAARTAIDAHEAAHGPIDILVNNAGVQFRAPLLDFPPEEFERLMRTNVTSLFNVGQACARHMIARGRGKIINIASVQTSLARAGIAPYGATKGAVGNLTKGMAADWARLGINCNAIAPGYIRTDLNRALQEDPAFDAWLVQRTPAGRWGETRELVGACVFLASAASDFVHGHVLFVDGGITATV
jgi:gluconate 5-dehydrogenase